MPWILANLLDAALGAGGPRELGAVAGLLVGLFGLRAVLAAAHGAILARAGEGAVLTLRRRLYDHLTRLGPPFYEDRPTGELVSRLMSDVGQVQAAVTSDVAALAASALTGAGAAAVLAWRSWRLALLVLVIVPPVVVAARAYGRRMRRLGGLVQDRAAETAAVAQEALGAMLLVQSFVREPHERARFGRAADALMGASLARTRAQVLFGPAVTFLSMSALVVVLWFGGREVQAGLLSPGELVALLVYTSMVATSASELVGLVGRLAAALGASRRVFALLDRAPEVADRPGARPLEAARGRVAFEGVSFAYGRAGPALADVDLVVEAGETLALVGPSGAGKSTLMHLVARFYDPTAGRVCLDGHDLRDLTLDSLRAQVGLVPQETTLFNATVAENLRYGRLEATDAELVAAARAAHADGFVRRLPDGYETRLGERGVRLSAGERQRLAIARALLKDPRVLLLDEATASLDSESEALVQAALARLMADRTTLVIAHRLSTVRGADRIAVVDRGRIVERGDHAALLAHGGLYARLYALQFRDAPAGVP